jgi:hypothetical protein
MSSLPISTRPSAVVPRFCSLLMVSVGLRAAAAGKVKF